MEVRKEQLAGFITGAIALVFVGMGITYTFFTYCRAPNRMAVTANDSQKETSPSEQQNSATPTQLSPSVFDSKSQSGQLVQVSGSDSKLIAVVKRVSQHIALPTGKVTVGTVTSPEKSRKDNPIFYQNARKGDQVLLYADRAILYSPVIDRILDVWHYNP